MIIIRPRSARVRAPKATLPGGGGHRRAWPGCTRGGRRAPPALKAPRRRAPGAAASSRACSARAGRHAHGAEARCSASTCRAATTGQ
eukprot:scaffold5988_cov381-Prasinococcus_capsulatus_cf.AAC.5